MAMTKEEKFKKLIKDIMKECEKDGEPVTEEEATEMARMEMGFKENFNAYTVSAEPKQKKETKPRTVKISDNKKYLYSIVLDALKTEFAENVTVLTENKLIQVKIGEDTFKIDLIQQRNKKN